MPALPAKLLRKSIKKLMNLEKNFLQLFVFCSKMCQNTWISQLRGIFKNLYLCIEANLFMGRGNALSECLWEMCVCVCVKESLLRRKRRRTDCVFWRKRICLAHNKKIICLIRNNNGTAQHKDTHAHAHTHTHARTQFVKYVKCISCQDIDFAVQSYLLPHEQTKLDCFIVHNILCRSSISLSFLQKKVASNFQAIIQTGLKRKTAVLFIIIKNSNLSPRIPTLKK